MYPDSRTPGPNEETTREVGWVNPRGGDLDSSTQGRHQTSKAPKKARINVKIAILRRLLIGYTTYDNNVPTTKRGRKTRYL